MQNSSGDDSGMIEYQISQMDLLWNLHCGSSHICSVGPLITAEINLRHDLPTSVKEIRTGSV